MILPSIIAVSGIKLAVRSPVLTSSSSSGKNRFLIHIFYALEKTKNDTHNFNRLNNKWNESV